METKTETTYEAPEIFELGDAEELTLGLSNLDEPDCTDCTRKKDPLL